MEIKTSEEIWDDNTEYDCGDSGTESIAHFDGDKNKKWVAVDDLKKLIDKYKFDEKIFFIRLLQHLGLVKILNSPSSEKGKEE